jgi:hypothetical protein
MARTRIASVDLSRAGVADPTDVATDAANGNFITNTGKTALRVVNTDATNPHTITFVTPGTVDGQAVADRDEVIPAGTTQWFGKFPTSVYGSSMGINVDSALLHVTVFEP